MKFLRTTLVGILLTTAITAPALSADHLKCYKIKDPLKLRGIVDLSSPQFGLQPGCTIGKTALFCVPASKSVSSATDTKTKLPIVPLPVSGPPAQEARMCYKVTCPVNPPPPPGNTLVTDQFGVRTFTKLKSSLLCTPAVNQAGFCGDGTVAAGEQCEGANLNGTICASLGFTGGGTLSCDAGCRFDTSACVCASTANCGNGIRDGNEQCDGNDLGVATCTSFGFPGGTLGCTTQCAFEVGGCSLPQRFPATGQTTCWSNAGAVIACAGTGQDGDIRAGRALSYADNGDGTITDDNTRLVWEKKSADGSIHDLSNTYTWDDAFAVHVAGLNALSFAGHADWRLPNMKEVWSLRDYQNLASWISPAFNSACASGCTALTCSCDNGEIWSSTTVRFDPDDAWYMTSGGYAYTASKLAPLAVRAVRGGS